MERSVTSMPSFDPSVASMSSFDPSDEEYDPSSDDEASPSQPSSSSMPQLPRSQITPPKTDPVAAKRYSPPGVYPELSDETQLRAKLRETGLKLAKAEGENQKIKWEHQTAVTELRSLESKLSEEQTKADKLSVQLRKESARGQTLDKDLRDLREELQRSRDQITQKDKSFLVLKQARDKDNLNSGSKVGDLSRQIRSLESQLSSKGTTIVSKDKEIELAAQETQTLKSRVKELEQFLSVEQEAKKVAVQRAETVEDEGLRKDSRISTLETEIKQQQSKYTCLMDMVDKTAREKGSDLLNLQEQLKEITATSEKALEGLRIERDTLQSQLTDSEKQRRELMDNANEALASETRQLQAQIQQKDSELTEARKLEAKKEEDNKALRVELEAKTQECVSMEASVQSKEEAIKTLNADLQALRSATDEERETAIADVKKERDEALSKLQELRSGIDTADLSTRQILEELRTELDQQKRKADGAELVANDVRQSLQVAQEKLISAESERDRLKQANEELSAKGAEGLEESLAKQRVDNKALQDKVDSLESQMLQSEQSDVIKAQLAERDALISQLKTDLEEAKSRQETLKVLEAKMQEETEKTKEIEDQNTKRGQENTLLSRRLEESNIKLKQFAELQAEWLKKEEELVSTLASAKQKAKADELTLASKEKDLLRAQEDLTELETQLQALATGQTPQTSTPQPVALQPLSSGAQGTEGPGAADEGPAPEPLVPKGVGLGFTFKRDSRTGNWQVNRIKSGGFAESCGQISSGDIIVAVDGKKCKGISQTELGALIMGQASTKVQLTLQKEGTPGSVTISAIRQKAK